MPTKKPSESKREEKLDQKRGYPERRTELSEKRAAPKRKTGKK